MHHLGWSPVRPSPTATTTTALLLDPLAASNVDGRLRRCGTTRPSTGRPRPAVLRSTWDYTLRRDAVPRLDRRRARAAQPGRGRRVELGQGLPARSRGTPACRSRRRTVVPPGDARSKCPTGSSSSSRRSAPGRAAPAGSCPRPRRGARARRARCTTPGAPCSCSRTSSGVDERGRDGADLLRRRVQPRDPQGPDADRRHRPRPRRRRPACSSRRTSRARDAVDRPSWRSATRRSRSCASGSAPRRCTPASTCCPARTARSSSSWSSIEPSLFLGLRRRRRRPVRRAARRAGTIDR